MIPKTLEEIANYIVSDGKGILAADESSGTIEKRFKSINVESTEDNRRKYREMLFRSPVMAEAIGGVILFDETLRQKSSDGDYLRKLLAIPPAMTIVSIFCRRFFITVIFVEIFEPPMIVNAGVLGLLTTSFKFNISSCNSSPQ